MYHHLRGTLLETGPMLAVVEVAGVGYAVRVPLSTLEALRENEEVFLFTHLWVREDDLRLFGFASRGEREMFRLMLSVSGIGPSIALAALSALPVRELALAFEEGDISRICRIKGVGKRLAERLAVELKDRVARLDHVTREDTGEAPAGGVPHRHSADVVLQDAVAALVELGYKRKAAEEKTEAVFKRLVESAGGESDAISVESLIREALR